MLRWLAGSYASWRARWQPTPDRPPCAWRSTRASMRHSWPDARPVSLAHRSCLRIWLDAWHRARFTRAADACVRSDATACEPNTASHRVLVAGVLRRPTDRLRSVTGSKRRAARYLRRHLRVDLLVVRLHVAVDRSLRLRRLSVAGQSSFLDLAVFL